MKYSSGQVGRMFLVRFDNGDDIHEELTQLVVKEKVKAGWIQLIGGLRSCSMVTGPEEPTMPPVPIWNSVEDAHELLASGSILWDEDKPIFHLHGALGNKDGVKVGCLREMVKAYLLIEAVIFEATDITASRPWYKKGEFYRMEFSNE